MGLTDMLKRLFLLLLLAFVSTQVVLPVVPAWADDDGGDSDGGDSDGGDSDGGDSGGGDHDGGDHDGGDSDGGDSDGGGDDGTSDGGYDDGDEDQERARAGRMSGNLLPLSAILKSVRRRYPGTVLKVSLKRRNGAAYYEIRILDRRDRLRTVTVSAGPRRKGNWTSRK